MAASDLDLASKSAEAGLSLILPVEQKQFTSSLRRPIFCLMINREASFAAYAGIVVSISGDDGSHYLTITTLTVM